jgi:transcription initiation factor IIE alpha subunit
MRQYFIYTFGMQRLGDTTTFKDRNLRLKGADIATQRGWTGVPNFILESKEISVGAKLIYAMLLKYARELDECFPGQNRLAEDMGNGERSVRRWLRELEQVGLVTIKQRGQGRPNLYTVHIKASFWKKHRPG